ncbi:MAG: hypothetical protein K0Q49_1765 [Haloplasmataceae bacterium]|jgi:hypothetical protein|nr:hypothetical protein [Haloplasmataceae bacterium]
MYFSYIKTFSLTFRVVREKLVKILFLFLINGSLMVVTYLVLLNNQKKVVEDFWLELRTTEYIYSILLSGWCTPLLLVLIVVGIISNNYLISLVQDTLYNKNGGLKSTFKGLFDYISGLSWVLLLLYFLTSALGLIVYFVPSLGIQQLSFLGYLLIIFYLIGYYRFIPYYSVIKSKVSFSEIKRLLFGKFWYSISILLIYYLIIFLINLSYENILLQIFFTKIGGENYSTSTIFVFIIIQLISLIIKYFQNLFDISFISLAIKGDKNKKEEETDITINR